MVAVVVASGAGVRAQTVGDQVDRVLAMAPRLEADARLRAHPDLHRAVTLLLDAERVALASTPAVDAARAARADALMLIGLRLLPHTSAETRAPLATALLMGRYAPDSRCAVDLARLGADVLPPLRVLATHAVAAHRANAYAVMARMLAMQAEGELEEPISLHDHLSVLDGLRAGLDDEDALNRSMVVDALARLGDGGSLPTLTTLARRDVSPAVRARARDALERLGR